MDGNLVSKVTLASVHDAIEDHLEKGGRRPGLAVVLVGNDTASSIYVNA